MTLQEANQIWDACYGPESSSASWDAYTWKQREQAMATREASCLPSWGIWNISDRD